MFGSGTSGQEQTKGAIFSTNQNLIDSMSENCRRNVIIVAAINGTSIAVYVYTVYKVESDWTANLS